MWILSRSKKKRKMPLNVAPVREIEEPSNSNRDYENDNIRTFIVRLENNVPMAGTLMQCKRNERLSSDSCLWRRKSKRTIGRTS